MIGRATDFASQLWPWMWSWRGGLALTAICLIGTTLAVLFCREGTRQPTPQPEWRFIDDDDVAAVIAAAEYMCAEDASKRAHPSWRDEGQTP